MSILKIVFLDIDGVLNYQSMFNTIVEKDNELEYEVQYFSPECVERLNMITSKTGAKIVLTSSWRIGRTLEQIQELFLGAGITGEVIGKTKRLNYGNSTQSVPRGCEVRDWVHENKGILGTNTLNWKDYVILDDESDMLYWQRNNFFQTDGSGVGLTENLTYRIINFLK